MENRCRKIMSEEKNSIACVAEQLKGESSVETRPVFSKTEVCNQSYANPPIPERYRYVEGKWDNGFVIERCSDGSQFVWIPVGCLDANGTTDGVEFLGRFGRRIYSKFSEENAKFEEYSEGAFDKQIESVAKYGGFYISKFYISRNPSGMPQTVKSADDCTKLTFFEAKELASTMEQSESVRSHLIFGAEFDSVLEWLIHSKQKKVEEIVSNSISCEDMEDDAQKLLKTSEHSKWCVNKIFFDRNLLEWTQEIAWQHNTLRGVKFVEIEDIFVAYRLMVTKGVSACFRVALYIR